MTGDDGIREIKITITGRGDPDLHASFEGSPISVLALLPRLRDHLLMDNRRFCVSDVVWNLDLVGAVRISVVADEEVPVPAAAPGEEKQA